MESLTKHPDIVVIISEIVLSLYPILIKLIPTDLGTQILARMGTFAALSLPYLSSIELTEILQSPIEIILKGLVNFTHVETSYTAFKNLSAGTAMALFYLYPFFNLVAGYFLFSEEITLFQIFWFVVAVVGAYLLIQDELTVKLEETKEETEAKEKISNSEKIVGIFSAISAAVTETVIYSLFKGENANSPYPGTFQLYGGGLLWFLVYKYFKKDEIIKDSSIKTWIPLILFNGIIGFLGYTLRFWAIPKLSVYLFSLLSFVGVFSAYIFGAIFAKEIPTVQSLVGGGLIALAISVIRPEL
jgi:drug/metabolite transporter (DMT)-like permease